MPQAGPSHATTDAASIDRDQSPTNRTLPGLTATFRSLRHRNYQLYFIGQLVSLTGTWMQQTALAWLAFDLTHESKWAGWVTAAQILPTFLIGLWGGALADRWPKRSLIFATQSGFLVLALLLTGLALGGVITPWQLLAVSMANGFVQAIDLPARLAFVMDLVKRDDLINAVALNSLIFNLARAVGPAVAGLIMAWLTPWACFLANALSYVAVLWALASMNITASAHPQASTQPKHRALDVFRYVARHRSLAFLILLVASTAFFGWPFQALLPALAKQELGSDERGYGLLVSATGVGALVAAWTIATFGAMRHSNRMIAAGVALVSTAMVALAYAPRLSLATFCCAVIGFGLILFFATSQSVIQLSAGDHNRGRIMAIWAMTVSGAVPLGNLLASPAADRWGVPLVLVVQGMACAVTAVLLLILLRPEGEQPVPDAPAVH
jgi:MFS family permease